MAAQLSPLSLEEFHQRYDGAKPAYEYWYGTAVQKSMPTALHGILQAVMIMLLERAGWNTASEVRLKLRSDAEPIPDVIAVRGILTGPYPASSPELCIEIMSPGDRLAKTLDKARVYLSWGTKCVWVIDPEARAAWTLTNAEESSEPAWVSPGGTLRVDETAISLADIFAEVDRKWRLTAVQD
jgi:Uma2 family endonuclease